MAALKYWDVTTGSYKELFSGQQGAQGIPGPPGPPGDGGPLNNLSDVEAPGSTPVGKILGTTATGLWGPIDPPLTGLSKAEADGYYVNTSGGDSMAGPLTIGGALTVSILTANGKVLAGNLEAVAGGGGVIVNGRITNVSAPAAVTDGANKEYVDSRIWTGTQAQYNAIVTKDPVVLYVVVG